MKTRLILAFVLAANVLCGCATESLRPSGHFSDGTFYQEIGKPLPIQMPLPDCRVR